MQQPLTAFRFQLEAWMMSPSEGSMLDIQEAVWVGGSVSWSDASGSRITHTMDEVPARVACSHTRDRVPRQVDPRGIRSLLRGFGSDCIPRRDIGA